MFCHKTPLSYFKITVNHYFLDFIALVYKTRTLVIKWFDGYKPFVSSLTVCSLYSNTVKFFTRWGWLDLGLLWLLLALSHSERIRWGFLSTLHFALVGKQVLDVLLLEGTGRAAGRPHIQMGGELSPFLVLIYLFEETFSIKTIQEAIT